MKIRVGFGFDVHQLVTGRELWLGGIKFEHELGLLGHSDADVLIHAICDALLGAANMRDIGYHFPDTALINKEAAGVKYMDGERLYDNQDLCEMLRTSKRSLQRFRSEYGLRYQKISRKTYYKESDVLEFISRNMEEVTLDGKKVLKVKDGTGKKAPGKTAKGKKGGRRNTGTDKRT